MAPQPGSVRTLPSGLTVYSVFPYHSAGGVRLRWLKFAGQRGLAVDFGCAMGELLPAYILAEQPLFACVPSGADRLKERGYNQSAGLAKYAAMRTDCSFCPDLLKKVKKNKTQHEISAEERILNVQGVYARNPDIDIKSRHIVLVDDIVTTGATLEACAAVLAEGEVSQITALTALATGRK
ncbi:MAG: hypothetical protein LBR73_01345 [Oscillospiraceae bacterium]|nr:hypothetical protein [Oscillospiraceae bacterium]